MTAILYKGQKRRGLAWREVFGRRLPDVEFRIWPETGRADDVRYLATWEPVDDLQQRFPNLEVLFSTGAGVDQFELGRLPEPIKLVRLIDPAIIDGMREYVLMAVLLLQRQMLDYWRAQADRQWRPLAPRLATDVTVGVMGLGVLGRAVLDALRPFNFPLRGWSRSAHEIVGVRCFAGAGQLSDFVRGSNIVVCVLPLTEATRGILGSRLFDAMPRASGLVNVGRGAHLRENDLLAALADGRLAGAVLDVFGEEPLPDDHPFWSHQRVMVTPHVAATTGYESAANALVDNILRQREGEPMIGLVDRESGY